MVLHAQEDMMPVTESDISRSTQAAWKAVFGRSLEGLRGSTNGAAKKPHLVARVRLMGSIQRELLIACPMEEARLLAAGFFRKDAATLDAALVEDVFGELANMIGGLIKRHLPHSTRLSLPEILRGDLDDAGKETVAQALFQAGHAPLTVKLLQTPS